jgi:hypothetical protein
MENISFIPNTQKNSEGYVSIKEERPYRGYIIGFLLILIMYIGALGFVYWYFIIQPTNTLNESIASLNAKNSIYYPKDDLQQTLYNLDSIISEAYDPVTMIKVIEATYGPNFKVTSWTYNKQKKNIVFSATANSFEDVNEQITKMKAVQGVVDVSYPDLKKSPDGNGVAIDITIQLK